MIFSVYIGRSNIKVSVHHNILNDSKWVCLSRDYMELTLVEDLPTSKKLAPIEDRFFLIL